MNFEDLTQPEDLDKNIGGTAQLHYFCKLIDLYTLPKASATPTDFADIVTIDTAFQFYLGKKFYKMYSTIDTGRVFDKMVGEVDGQSFESSFEWNFPGTEAQALGMISLFKTHQMIFVAVESNGKRRLIGNDEFPARLTFAEADSGLKTADAKRIKLKVESRGLTPAPIVAESVSLPTSPAIIDPEETG